ncbi:hypothetical protein ACJMK2_039953 [Sinanodonta woodiana]|uniref:Uncharacterized protein n=1 Tax=Sinanodonta woodiana TaxID=1069815 RepID=A0ABD3WDI8_SINWO
MTSVLAAASLDPEIDTNHMTSVRAAASLDPEIDTNHMTSVRAAASLDPEKNDTTISSDMTQIVKRNKIRITPPNRHTQTHTSSRISVACHRGLQNHGTFL